MTEKRIGKEYYNTSAYFDDPDYLSLHQRPFHQYRVAKVLEIYRPESKSRVVDLGCGWGTCSFALAEVAGEVVGVDFSEKSIALCERRLEQQPMPNLRFVCADAGDTGLAAGAWDLVVAADLLEHLYPDDSIQVVAESFRLLRSGGRFSVWTPHRGHFLEILKNNEILLKRPVSHVDYKSMKRMTGIMRDAGFEIERSYYAESHLPGLRQIERSLQGFVPFLRRRVVVLGRKPID